jgi:hypothetical protein
VNDTNDYGIWSEGSGTLALVAREGDQAPGTPSGVTYENLRLPVLNDAGQTAFSASLTGNGVDGANNGGIWCGDSGNLTLVARSGEHAPGTPSGVNFDFATHTDVVINNAGQTAFNSSLAGVGVDATNNEGIWLEGSGSLRLVARRGSHAPGTPNGTNFAILLYPVLNDAGQTAFRAILTSGESGIWSEGTGELALVARGGMQAPGTPSGVTFSSVANQMHSPLLNSAGQTAFFGLLTGSGVDSRNNEGIWATDPRGLLRLIAREGDLLEVAPGDFRTIGTPPLTPASSLHLEDGWPTGNSDGHASAFNNLGQITFLAYFTDGSSGIFVSNRVAIPEPATIALAASALGVVTLLRGARRPHKH